MSVLIAQLRGFQENLAFEIQRFMLLWRYQHHTPPFALWWRLVLKRTVDFIGASILVLLLSPFLLFLFLLVKLTSRGPALYTQERVGLYGSTFNIYKFRTMVKDAEAKTGPVWTAKVQDPRVTPLGRLLRRSHLDELPQLFNVLAGQMSLVGPRPERPCFVQELQRVVPRYEHRHYLKPGITGLAQVHYRYDQTIADVKKKLRFDLLYMRRMCLLLDMRILAWTFLVVVTGRGIR